MDGLSVSGVLWLLVATVAALPVMCAPTIIALFRDHRCFLPIFLVNLLTGWTFFGWVVALVWSVTPDPSRAGADLASRASALPNELGRRTLGRGRAAG